MGANRELKKATEAYWGGKLSQEELLAEGKRLREEHWKIQKDAGVDIIPSNDFSFYDQVLDHIHLFGVRTLPSCPTVSLRSRDLTFPNRSSRRDTASMVLLPLMSTSLWDVVSSGPLRILTFLAW